MAELKSLEALIQQMADNARGQIAAELRPHVQAISAAAAAMEAALAGGRRRGRRPKSGVASSQAPKQRARKAGGKKVKRGALVGHVMSILAESDKGMKVAEIRNAVAAKPEYRDRKSQSLYSQVMQTLGRIPEVVKTREGLYTIKGGRKK